MLYNVRSRMTQFRCLETASTTAETVGQESAMKNSTMSYRFLRQGNSASQISPPKPHRTKD